VGPVKVGVLQFFSWPERRIPLNEVYTRALDRIDVMDRTGYDAVWLAEHHFNTFSVCPSVHLMGMHVADRTTNLRIGMAVTLAAFYHPLRIAEEIALLDVLSGGRVNWGAGRGFDRTEHTAFGIDADESYPRFREHVEIVRSAWTDDRLTFHGRYWDFDNVEVLPKPLQQPHPPMWVASSSPDAIAWSAQRGYSIMMDPHSAHDEIGRKFRAYSQALTAAGHSPEGRDTPMARLLAVAATRSEAEQIARRGAAWTVGAYANPGRTAIGSGLTQEPAASAPAVDPVERYVNDVVLWGTPSELVDKVAELNETIGLGYLMCAPLSHSSFELFTEQVLPRLI
jgi:alkanesulfonate monooxygenase SsuD/methylene tetrahydromethanopterin reductase-like flavin-dependent oxidoreductase (luciferase family)